MISIVYPFGTASRFNNNELRFSLRSIEKYLKNYSSVFVIGETLPDWITNVTHIKSGDKTSISDTNIMHKITLACQTPEISDNFLMVHDDHYLLQDYDAETFPYFYSSSIDGFLKHRVSDSYARRVKNTLNYLQAKGLPTLFFDVHTPIIFNKLKFLQYVTNGPDWTPPNTYTIKSIYANSLGIEGVHQVDNKTDKAPVNGKIFSTAARVTPAVQRFLLERFPKKSAYEVRDFA